MLTHPAAAARAAVATGVRDKIDTHVSETWKRASLSYLAAHPPADLTKKKERESIRLMIGTCTSSTSLIKLFGKKFDHMSDLISDSSGMYSIRMCTAVHWHLNYVRASYAPKEIIPHSPGY